MRGDQPALGVICFIRCRPLMTKRLSFWNIAGNRPLYQPPIIHIRFLNAMLIGRSL
jgi:hypothetical protein